MRALLIEDDATIAQVVTRGLGEAGYAVVHASDGIEGLDAALNDGFDVAVVDLMLPRLGGLEIIERMRRDGIRSPVLILSAQRSVDQRVDGLRRGGDDYLVKPFAFRELLARVDALVRRASERAESGTELAFEDLSLDLLSRRVTRAGRRVDLQPKEFALLEYLIRNAGHVVSRTMIMERVWNYRFDPCTNVVEARVSKLREKIDRGFDVPLIHTVRGVGYVLRAPDG